MIHRMKFTIGRSALTIPFLSPSAPATTAAAAAAAAAIPVLRLDLFFFFFFCFLLAHLRLASRLTVSARPAR
jgi:hypothetical protein